MVTGGLWGGRRSTGGHYVEDDDGPPTIESRENSVRKMTEVRAEEGGANMELPPALRLEMVERQEIRIKVDGRMVKVNLETMAFTPEKQMSTKFPQVDSLRACEEDYKCWNDYCEMLIGKFTRQLGKMHELREIPYDPEYDLPTAAEQYCVDKIEHYTGMKNFMYEHWVCFAQKKLRTAMAHSSPADRAKGVMRVFNYMNAVRRASLRGISSGSCGAARGALEALQAVLRSSPEEVGLQALRHVFKALLAVPRRRSQRDGRGSQVPARYRRQLC